MPDDFIRYRDFFEKAGLIVRWEEEYHKLSMDQRKELLQLLSIVENEVDVMNQPHSKSLNEILVFYSVKKNKVEKSRVYYLRLCKSRVLNEALF